MERNESYVRQLGKMQAPIPGQSLTEDPGNPKPYEQAPEFTKKGEALQEIFGNMVREENYVPMMQAVIEGTTVMEMTQVLLFEGFKQGKWNPDLFMLLVEPTAYMVMALAERADVDYEIDREGEEPDPDSEIEAKFSRIGNGLRKGEVKPGVITPEMEEQIEELPEEVGLIQRPQQEEVPEEPVDEGLITKRV